MKIGYAGAATDDDAGGAAQLFDLQSAGCARLYHERFTGKASNRPRLRAMLDALQPGDTVVVTRLDRLARSTADLLDIASSIKAKGAGLLVLDLAQVDVRTNRDLIPVVIDTIAAFDRRTSVDGKAAPAPGKPVATKAASAPVDEAEVRRLRARGFSPLRIAKKLKVVPASVYGALVGRPAP